MCYHIERRSTLVVMNSREWNNAKPMYKSEESEIEFSLLYENVGNFQSTKRFKKKNNEKI